MKRVVWISTVTACGIFFVAGPTPVSAQQSQAQTEGSEIEEIVITGSRIKRTDLTSVGPVTILDAPQIAATGVTSLEVLLQRLPSSAGFGGNQTSAYWVSNGWGTPQINLR